MAPEPGAFAQEVLRREEPDSFLAVPVSGVEVAPYRAPHSLLLHIVRHEPSVQSVVLRLPDTFRPAQMTAELFTPDSIDRKPLPLPSAPDGLRIALTTVPAYGVIKIALR